MNGIIARKVGITSIYQGDRLIPVTIVETMPSVVTQVRTKDVDGYVAVQLGYDEKKEKNTTKPLQGHFKKAGVSPKRRLVEFRTEEEVTLSLGDAVKAEDVFEEGEYIDAVAISKGKGFTGVMKRHGFGGVGQRSHGQHNRERAPGSIGAASTPSRVFKGMRMAGRSGGDRVKVENLEVIKILPEENVMILKGSVPGPRKSYLVLQK